jgi:predicted metal-dependent hydrolase
VLTNLYPFDLEVVRSARRKKSLALHVLAGKVRVLIPHNLPQQQLADFLQDKQEWISNKVSAQRAKSAARVRNFDTGEMYVYLGKSYRLQIKVAPAEQLILLGDTLLLKLPQGVDVRAALLRWYWQQARHLLTVQTYEYAKIIGVTPASIAVKEYKARWGSCSIKADIKYNWKLIMAPQEVIDYVVIHELCHILEHNHSAAFWQHVARFAPDFKAQRKWLRINGSSLEI